MSSNTNTNEFRTGCGLNKTSQAGIPVKQDLTPIYILSLLITFIMALTSAISLVDQDTIYPTSELLQSFIASDVINISIGIPVLLVSMWLARNGKLAGLLCWPGVLFYVLYTYIPYLLAVPFNVLFVPYLMLVTLSIYALISLAMRIDGELLRQQLAGRVPLKRSAGVLIALVLIVVVRQAARIIAVQTGQMAVDPAEIPMWIDDFMVAVPLMLIAGTQLWRDKPIGYILGPGLLLGYGLLALGLIPFFVLQAHENSLPFDVAGTVTVLIMAVLCFIPLASFILGADRGRTSPQLANSSRIKHVNR
jgi:hypothetical protein